MSEAYQFVILPAVLTAAMGVMLYQCAVDDPHELWDFWSRGRAEEVSFDAGRH